MSALAWFYPGFARSTWAASACAVLGALAASPAHATLLGDSVTVQLLSPNGIIGDNTPVNLTDVVVVAPGAEITAGAPGSNVGGFMLTGATAQEFIDLAASSISVRLLAGAEDQGLQVTGYASGGKLVFSGLDSLGEVIVAASATGTGFANFSAAWVTLDNPHQITLLLDSMVFTPALSGTTFGDINILLTTQPIPEPATWGLMALGLAVLGAAARRQRGPAA